MSEEQPRITNADEWARLYYQRCHEDIRFARSHGWQITYWGFVLYAVLAAIVKNVTVLHGAWAFVIGGFLLVAEAGYIFALHFYAVGERRKISNIVERSSEHGEELPTHYADRRYRAGYVAFQLGLLVTAFAGAMFWAFKQDDAAAGAGVQPLQAALWPGAEFWSAFWPGVTATFVGAVFGVPIGLWINRRTLALGQKQRRRNERRTVAHALDVLSSAITENQTRLQRLASVLAQDQTLHDTGIDTSTWDAVQACLTAEMEDPELRQQLAGHFSRLGAVVKLNDRYITFLVGVNASMSSAGKTRTALKAALEDAVSELGIEAPKLVEATSAARKQLLPHAQAK